MTTDLDKEKDILTDDEQSIYKRINVDNFSLDDLCTRLVNVTEQFSGLPYLYSIQKQIAYRYFEILLTDEPASICISISRQRGKSELFRAINATAMIFVPLISKIFHKKFQPLEKFYNPSYPKNNGVWIGHMSNTEYQALAVFDGTDKILKTEYAELIMSDDSINIKAKRVKDKIKMTNGSVMQWYSVHPQAKIESGTFKVLQYDEAQDMTTSRYQTDASPMGAAWNAPEFFFGVAGRTRNYFYDLIKNNRFWDKKQKGYKRRAFISDYRQGLKESAYYSSYIKKKKSELGEESESFQLSYMLKWLFESGMAVSDRMIIVNQKKNLELGVHGLKRGMELYFGLDFAKTDDKTVLMIGTKHWDLQVNPEIQPPKQLLAIHSWNGTDYDTQFYEACDIIDDFIRESHGISIKMTCDGTGVGDAQSDRFVNRYEFEMEVEVIKYSLPTKSKLAKNAITELKGGRMWIPHSQFAREDSEIVAMKNEIKTIEKKTRGQYVICNHPDIKSAHDDYWDSLCNLLWSMYLPGMGEVEEIPSNNFIVNPFRQKDIVEPVMAGVEYDQFGRRLTSKPNYINEIARSR